MLTCRQTDQPAANETVRGTSRYSLIRGAGTRPWTFVVWRELHLQPSPWRRTVTDPLRLHRCPPANPALVPQATHSMHSLSTSRHRTPGIQHGVGAEHTTPPAEAATPEVPRTGTTGNYHSTRTRGPTRHPISLKQATLRSSGSTTKGPHTRLILPPPRLNRRR